MTWPATVEVVEVGPRDGLQNEHKPVSLSAKCLFIEQLTSAGLRRVEAGGFVSQNWVPQMAESSSVFAQIRRRPGVAYSALVPNRRGFEDAVAAKADEVAIFLSASETFSQKNINCSIAESLRRAAEVLDAAKTAGISVRGYLSCVAGCPYEGAVDPAKVADLASQLVDLGCREISLGDTIGVGTPGHVVRLLRAICIPRSRLAVHFHDTYGQALANVVAALDEGVRVVDASAGGLGGCPYALGAAGNLATEDLVYMLNGMGIETGVDLDGVVAAAHAICAELGRAPSSKLAAIR